MEKDLIQKTDSSDHPDRPLILSALCIINFIYFCIILLLFIGGLVSSSWVYKVINTYFSEYHYSKFVVFLMLISGTLLTTGSLYGIIKMWFLKKMGFFIYLIASLLIVMIQLVRIRMDWLNISINLFFIILFSLYVRKMT
jgi:hypothetical protein